MVAVDNLSPEVEVTLWCVKVRRYRQPSLDCLSGLLATFYTSVINTTIIQWQKESVWLKKLQNIVN